MDSVKLTITITAIISFAVLIFKNCLGIDLLTTTDAGTLAGAIVTVIASVYAGWKAVAEYIAIARAKAAEARANDAEGELVEVRAQLAATQTKYEKAISGQK